MVVGSRRPGGDGSWRFSAPRLKVSRSRTSRDRHLPAKSEARRAEHRSMWLGGLASTPAERDPRRPQDQRARHHRADQGHVPTDRIGALRPGTVSARRYAPIDASTSVLVGSRWRACAHSRPTQRCRSTAGSNTPLKGSRRRSNQTGGPPVRPDRRMPGCRIRSGFEWIHCGCPLRYRHWPWSTALRYHQGRRTHR